MPTTVDQITIDLPPEMLADVLDAVQVGDYASSSEVVRDALRDWTCKRKLQRNGISQLRQLWQEARSDRGEGLEPDAVFDELERKYQRLAGQPVQLDKCVTL